MRALLLAAGLGTRLRPLTDHLPKCMVPIHGRPLLDYWLQALVEGGVEQVLINTHYLSPIVHRYLELSSWMPWVTLVHEDQLLGTGGTMLNNQAFFGEHSLLVAHADNLTQFDVAAFIDAHQSRPPHTEMTMMLFEAEDPRSCGIVELDPDGVVQAFHEKVEDPPGVLANAAVYIFEPTVFERLQKIDTPSIDLSTQVIPDLIGRIASFHNVIYHRDIGTMDSWRQANRDFPVQPATSRNAQAWQAVLASEPHGLPDIVSGLLA